MLKRKISRLFLRVLIVSVIVNSSEVFALTPREELPSTIPPISSEAMPMLAPNVLALPLDSVRTNPDVKNINSQPVFIDPNAGLLTEISALFEADIDHRMVEPKNDFSNPQPGRVFSITLPSGKAASYQLRAIDEIKNQATLTNLFDGSSASTRFSDLKWLTRNLAKGERSFRLGAHDAADLLDKSGGLKSGYLRNYLKRSIYHERQVRNALTRTREGYLRNNSIENEFQFARALQNYLNHTGVPSSIEVYTHVFSRFFVVFSAEGASNNWLAKYAKYLNKTGGKLGIAPEFIHGVALGHHLPGWGVLLAPKNIHYQQPDSVIYHEIGHFLMGAGPRLDPPRGRTKMRFVPSTELPFPIDLLPSTQVDALKAAYAHNGFDVMSFIENKFQAAYSHGFAAEESWTYRIDATYDLALAKRYFDSPGRPGKAVYDKQSRTYRQWSLYRALFGQVMAASAVRLLAVAISEIEAGPKAPTFQKHSDGFLRPYGDRVLILKNGNKFVTDGRRLDQTRKKNATLAALRQTLQETIEDDRTLKEVAESAIALRRR